MSAPLLRWDVPGPYAIAFTTRNGGVSVGPFASLNLGRRTGDEPARVDENRALVCAGLGADAARLALNHQVHGTGVNRAAAGDRGRPGDAVWTDEPGLPVAALAADCVPVALARTGAEPAVAVVHAGRIGLLGGVLQAAARALGGGLAAAIGPSAGPCCYEVGDDVAGPYRRRFGDRILRGRNLDLWHAADVSLRDAGVAVHRFDLCTICNPDLFFSHRRDGRSRGVQGVVAVLA